MSNEREVALGWSFIFVRRRTFKHLVIQKIRRGGNKDGVVNHVGKPNSLKLVSQPIGCFEYKGFKKFYVGWETSFDQLV